MMISKLKKCPKSKVIIPGYINIYSCLSEKEQNQIRYKVKYKQTHPSWDESQVYLANNFAKFVSNNLMVLDVGCGHGNYVIDENRGKINWAIGIDAEPEATRKNVCLDEIKHERIENMSLPDNHFDVCISLWLFEHLEFPKKALTEIYRVTKPGGYLMFTTPNKKFLPLEFIRKIKFGSVNHFLNQALYDRKSEDVFASYYKMNTLEDIKKIFTGKFNIINLQYNYDPSYLSFGRFGYKLNQLISASANLVGLNVLNAHIIGIARKI